MMLTNLRNATKKLHEDLEKDNLASQIITHKISLEDYKLLLLQNYIAYKVTDAEITKYMPNYKSEKSDQLAKDLKNLNVDSSISGEFQSKFSINSYEEALGAAYVVLGSALGGIYISKEIPSCPELANTARPHFFNGERDGVKSWNQFVKELKADDFNENQIAVASKKARETFEFFGLVFRQTSVSSQIS